MFKKKYISIITNINLIVAFKIKNVYTLPLFLSVVKFATYCLKFKIDFEKPSCFCD